MATILSVSLTPDLRSVLDAEAKRQRRSRSFVVAEAIREYVARQDRDAFSAARDRRTCLEGAQGASLWHLTRARPGRGGGEPDHDRRRRPARRSPHAGLE